jgi:hypothetical protein
LRDVASFSELRDDQAALRARALQQVHEHESTLRALAERHAACCEKFFAQLDAVPREAIVHYGRTRQAIVGQVNQVAASRDFLDHGKSSDRLVRRGNLRDKLAVACEVIGQGVAHESAIKEAIRVLDVRLATYDRQLAQLDSNRTALTGCAQAVLRSLVDLSRHRLIPADSQAAQDLRDVLTLQFCEGHSLRDSRTRRRRANERAAKVPATISLRSLLANAVEALAAEISTGIQRAAERLKRLVLRDAAMQLTARLDAWRLLSSYSLIERAILGLHFSFTCVQCGLGALEGQDLERRRRVLNQATDGEILRAVRSLLVRGVLARNQLDVFRYTPAVWRVVSDLSASL